MKIEIMQLNLQLFFREPVFKDQGRLAHTLLDYGFSHKEVRSEHAGDSPTVFFKDGFRVSVAKSNVLPDKILQIVMFPNSVPQPDKATVKFMTNLNDILLKEMGVSSKEDIEACRVVFHCTTHMEKDAWRC